MQPDFTYELELLEAGHQIIAGVDEVGRGCLAGPIVACAVVFSDHKKIKRKLKGIRDSKKLTAKMRESLDLIIRKHATHIGIGEVSVEEIDRIGIGAANILAFKRALDQIQEVNFALIDGRKFRGFNYNYRCLIQGESKSISIAAASIIAKVYRDRLMTELFSPGEDIYDFAENKGYGGKKHYSVLDTHGSSIHHRQTFLKKYYERKSQPKLF